MAVPGGLTPRAVGACPAQASLAALATHDQRRLCPDSRRDNDLWLIIPFGKGQDGKAVLICAKDRHDNYPLRRRVAALAVTSGVIHLKDETGSAAGDFRPTGLMERVSIVLEAATEPPSKTAVEKTVSGKVVHVRAALDSLVTDGYVRRDKGPNRTFLHLSVKPYREADDD